MIIETPRVLDAPASAGHDKLARSFLRYPSNTLISATSTVPVTDSVM